MDRKTHTLILNQLITIKHSAHVIIDATQDMEETDEIDDARNYARRILEQVQEAQGQWWA